MTTRYILFCPGSVTNSVPPVLEPSGLKSTSKSSVVFAATGAPAHGDTAHAAVVVPHTETPVPIVSVCTTDHTPTPGTAMPVDCHCITVTVVGVTSHRCQRRVETARILHSSIGETSSSATFIALAPYVCELTPVTNAASTPITTMTTMSS